MSEASRRIDYFAVANIPPWLPTEPIGSFRRANDPTVDLIEPHITLVFPVPACVGRGPFVEHVRDVVSRMPPFDIRLRGFERSWDHWLFLLVAEGREEVVALHDALYTGILRDHLRTEPPYVPHVGLGLFVEERDAEDLLEVRPRRLDRSRFAKASREAEALELDYEGRFDAVQITGLDEDLTHVTRLQELPLG